MDILAEKRQHLASLMIDAGKGYSGLVRDIAAIPEETVDRLLLVYGEPQYVY